MKNFSNKLPCVHILKDIEEGIKINMKYIG